MVEALAAFERQAGDSLVLADPSQILGVLTRDSFRPLKSDRHALTFSQYLKHKGGRLMMDLLLHEQDLLVIKGDFAVCESDTQAICQTIASRLKTIKGEWFMDAALGIPYFTEIFGHKRSERFIRHMIIPELQSIPGVRKIASLTTKESPDRTLKIAFEAVLTDGTAQALSETVSL